MMRRLTAMVTLSAADLLAVLLIAGPVLGAQEYIERVSTASNGSEGNDDSHGASISADGRYVAFDSDATNLVADDTEAWPDVFVHDRQTDETRRVSVSSDGEAGSLFSVVPVISANGRYVADGVPREPITWVNTAIGLDAAEDLYFDFAYPVDTSGLEITVGASDAEFTTAVTLPQLPSVPGE